MMTEEEAKTKWPIVGRLGWRSGHSKGYMRCKCPCHPNANRDGYVYEHIYRASLVLGRGLRKGETVHHIDGNPANNHNENLLICTHQYHRQLHERLGASADWPQFRARASKRPRCRLCGTRIAYESKSGLCVTHYFQNIRTEKKLCRAPGCTAMSGFRSGLCLAHVRFRTNKRRYSKGWDFNDAH